MQRRIVRASGLLNLLCVLFLLCSLKETGHLKILLSIGFDYFVVFVYFLIRMYQYYF